MTPLQLERLIHFIKEYIVCEGTPTFVNRQYAETAERELREAFRSESQDAVPGES